MEKDSFKIYFIYSQEGSKLNVEQLKPNEEIIKIEQISSGKVLNYLYILYCLTISNKKKVKFTTLTLVDNQGKLYTSKISLNKDEPFQYNVNFESSDYNDEQHIPLNQVKLPYKEQFIIFKNSLKKDIKMFYSLYLSRANSILEEMNNKVDFESLLIFIADLFAEYEQYNELKDIIKNLFEKINLKNVIYKIDDNSELSSLEEKHILDNINIRENLVLITNNKEEINEKIDVILSYYYLHKNRKLFIKYISNNNKDNKILEHLISNRSFFDNFSKDVINSQLLEEAEDLTQIKSLLSLLPSMVDCFYFFADEIFNMKLCCLSQIEAKRLNIMEINKPNKNDDIDLLSDYFDSMINNFWKERLLPIDLTAEFFVEYCKLFLNEDLYKIKLIINNLKRLNKQLADKFQIKIESKLNSYYKQTAVYLINNQKLKNMDLINFLEENPEFKNNENIENCIVLDTYYKKFTNEFLNDEIEDIHLKDLFRDNYYRIIKSIFNRMVLPKDMVVIKDWKIEDNKNKEITEIFLQTIKRIWLNHPENHMFCFEDLFAKEFGKASLEVENYKDIMDEIESHIPKDSILIFYSNLLAKKYGLSEEFKQHVINYINKNISDGPLGLWYKLTTFDEREDKIKYLKANLKDEYAVKVEDFIHYPEIISDRITLFTELYNSQFIDDVSNSNYYEESLKSKDNLENLKFNDAMIMYDKIDSFSQLFLFFVPGKFNEENQILVASTLIDFSDKCERAKAHHESLKTILNFWERFFPFEKKEARNNLQKLLNKYENSPLKEYNKLCNQTKLILVNLNEAKQGEKFLESIFFMGIYNYLKNKFNENQERERMNQTRDKIVEASYLPLSIIIVGIGNDDFELMDILDGDKYPLTNSRGELRKRDIVQFVKFEDFKKNNAVDYGTDLTEEVLKEIPTQVEEYYENCGKFY